MNNSLNRIEEIDQVIDKISIYRIDANVSRHFSYGTWDNRQHAVFKIVSDKCCGWGENTTSEKKEPRSL